MRTILALQNVSPQLAPDEDNALASSAVSSILHCGFEDET